MKFNALVLATLFAFAPHISHSQVSLKKIGSSLDKTLKGEKPLSNDEIVSGLKQALEVGSKNASGNASKPDGYNKNPLIRIPFPPEAADMEKKLRSIGMNKQVDEFELTMNRAAEEAAKDAAKVFLDAITGMSIQDGVSILRGNDTAATGFLRNSTNVKLHDDFKPVIKMAIQKVEVTKYWEPLTSAYNKIPFTKKVNPDLEEHITQRALSGLFVLVAQEEGKIRKNPEARVTDLLKKVFGSK